MKFYVWSMALYGAETWTLRAADRKHLESFEMWCWRRMEKISWTDHVRNEEVLLRVNEQRNILHEIRKRKANWIGHINTAINLSVPYNASEILDYLGNYKISFSRRTLQAS